MLLANYSYINALCGHTHSGITNPYNVNTPHSRRGYFTPLDASNKETIKRDSLPTGTNPPYSLMMGDKGALLSSTTYISGAGTITGNISKGINITASLEGSSSLASNLSLVVALEAALVGNGNLTAALVGVVQLAGALSGSASIAAALSLISNMNASLNGSGSIAGNLKGTLSLEADIYVNQSQATVDELVAGVWNALAAEFNASGTMGEAMGAAGTAGDPWTTTLPGTYTGDQAGAMVDRLETLIKQVKALTSAGL